MRARARATGRARAREEDQTEREEMNPQKLAPQLLVWGAEGIETEAERDQLAQLGCDLMQGYLFARPAEGFPTPRF